MRKLPKQSFSSSVQLDHGYGAIVFPTKVYFLHIRAQICVFFTQQKKIFYECNSTLIRFNKGDFLVLFIELDRQQH